MLMNFSRITESCQPFFLTADETDILVQCEKLEEEYRLYGGKNNATISESELLCTVPTATAELQSIHG